MASTTFSGPIKAGTIANTTGTTLGDDVKNVGQVVMTQSSDVALTHATTTASNQCVIGNTNLTQFQSNGFRDLDTKTANVLGIGKTNATKVEIAQTGVVTEVKGDLNILGGFNGLTPIGGVFSQIVTISQTSPNGIDQQSLIGTGVGSLTVPANTFKVGDSYALKIGGTKTNAQNNTLNIRIKAGSVILAESGIIILPALSADPYEIEVEFTVRSIGGTGVASIATNGNFVYTDAGSYKGFNFNNINSTTFDTTISNTLDVTVVQGSPGNNMTSDSLILTKRY